MMKQTLLFFFVLFGSVLAAIKEDATSKFYEELSRSNFDEPDRLVSVEDIIKARKRRKRQLKNMVHSMRRKLADHAVGEITLDPEEKKLIEYRMDVFQRKVDTLSEEIDERELNRILSREEAQARARLERTTLSRARALVHDEVPIDASKYEL